MAVEIYAFDF